MAIIDKDGRPRSVRTPEEEHDLLLADIKRLPADEQHALLEVYEQLQRAEAEEATKNILHAEYATAPVDIRTFLSEPYFLGETGRQLWPKLADDIVELFEGNYPEAILGGSLGWGKSYMATTAMAYVLYQMSCLRSPQRAYGIDPGSHIYVAMLSVTEKVARRVVINELLGKISYSRYFKEQFPFKAAPSQLEIRFPQSVQIVAGSTGSSAILGLNVYSGFIDESSFMGDATQIDRTGRIIAVDQGEAIYKSIIRRMKSRFQRVGRLPGVLIVASSKERPSAFIEKRVQQAKEEKDRDFFVREYATWDVKPEEFFSSDVFKVAVGNDRIQSRILAEGDEESETRYRDLGLQVIDVPIDYREDFERDIEGALRDVAGVATEAVSNYIQRTDKIFNSEKESLPSPVEHEEWVANTPLEIRWGLIAKSFKRRLPGGYEEVAWKPIRHPSAIRYVHIDPSLTGDCTGFVMAHIAHWTEVIRRVQGEEYTELAPMFETDLILRIKPPPGDEILLSDVRSIVYQFMEHGFNIGYVSQDQYQSADGLQQIRKRGVEAEVVSVDRTTEPYDVLKAALYEDRVNTQCHGWLYQELRSLQRVPKGRGKVKIDHPKKMTSPDGNDVTGSKDVADALAGVIYSLTMRSPGRPIPPVMGISQTAGAQEKIDDTWVSDGKVMVSPKDGRKGGRRGSIVGGQPAHPKDAPMPFTKG